MTNPTTTDLQRLAEEAARRLVPGVSDVGVGKDSLCQCPSHIKFRETISIIVEVLAGFSPDAEYVRGYEAAREAAAEVAESEFLTFPPGHLLIPAVRSTVAKAIRALLPTESLTKDEDTARRFARRVVVEDITESHLPAQPEDEDAARRYLMGSCTEFECRLCHTPLFARKAGMKHSGISAVPVQPPEAQSKGE